MTLKVLPPGVQWQYSPKQFRKTFPHDRNKAQQKEAKLSKAGERRGEERKRKVKSRGHLETLQSVHARTLEADIILFMKQKAAVLDLAKYSVGSLLK